MQDAPKHYSMLTTPDTEYWRRIRKTINEAFSPAAMRKVGASGQKALLGGPTWHDCVPAWNGHYCSCTAQQASWQASGSLVSPEWASQMPLAASVCHHSVARPLLSGVDKP